MASSSLTSLFIILTLLPLVTHSIPFVVFHGVSDGCEKKPVKHFTDLLSSWSNTQGYCIEIGNGVWDSWFMPFSEQVDIACEKVKNMSELSQGYNIVGLSQGNMVGRGVLEFCDGAPPVKNFISVAGPHAGEASIPFCGSGLMCILLDGLIKLAIYSDYLQEHLAPANYIKIPTDLEGYREGCKFLPKLNNEFEKNATYKERFTSLENLVLIMKVFRVGTFSRVEMVKSRVMFNLDCMMYKSVEHYAFMLNIYALEITFLVKFDKESVLVPKETSWFGYYPDGAWEPILAPQETRLYIEDWIGLRTLDEAGKVKFVNVTGGHLDMADADMVTYIVPYLVDEVAPENLILTESALEQPSSTSATNFIRKLVGQQDLQLNLIHRS